MKKCNKCGEVKPVSDFYKNKRTKDGLSYACRDCMYENKAEQRGQTVKEYKNKYNKEKKEKEKYMRLYHQMIINYSQLEAKYLKLEEELKKVKKNIAISS